MIALRILLLGVVLYNFGAGAAADEVEYCGQSNANPFQDRIVGGHEAMKHEFPWMVKLLSDYQFFCGGSLIADQFVLTAGHCLSTNTLRSPTPTAKSYKLRHAEDIYAEFGGHNTRDHTPFIRQGLEIIIHPEMKFFVTKGMVLQANDVALLRVKPIIFTPDIAPICLPEAGTKLPDNMNLILAGWGSVQTETLESQRFLTGALPTALMKTTMNTMNYQACTNNSNAGAYFSNTEFDEEHVICMIGDDTDSCRGDSGGPVVLNSNGVYFIEGVISWGIGCNQPDFPSAYMRVSSYIDFINNNTVGAKFLPSPPTN